MDTNRTVVNLKMGAGKTYIAIGLIAHAPKPDIKNIQMVYEFEIYISSIVLLTLHGNINDIRQSYQRIFH